MNLRIFKNPLLILGLIVFLGFIIRFYQLGKNPPGVTLDEAAIGWNANSILRTGRDEYGQFMPIQFRSLDDYKPPLYIYITVPSVATFGMNEFSVRFPAAVLGILAILMIYQVSLELFPGSKKRALIASFILSINPWAIQFSRTGYETGTTVFLYLIGIYFFSRGLKNLWFMIPSGLIFGLTIYMYQASRLFIPMLVLFLIGLSVLYRRINISKILLLLLVIALVCLPFVKTLFSSETQIRFKGTSIFQDVAPSELNLNRKITDWLRDDHWSADILHPEFLSYGSKILSNYLLHLRPDFFFIGDYGPKVSHAPNYGLFHPTGLILIPLGMYWLFRKKSGWQGWLIVGSILIAPIPAAFTLSLPSSIRTAVIAAPLVLLSSFGLFYLPKKLKYIIAPALIVFLGYYLHMYFVHLPLERADSWYYGYREMAEKARKLEDNYEKIFVSNKLDQPLNFFQFFTNYDPKTYLTTDGGRITGGFLETGNHFGKYYFVQPDFGAIKSKEKNILYIGSPDEFGEHENFLSTITLPNGKPWIRFKEIR